MAKILMIFCAALACVQLLRPLGWPGLKKRQDAWKLAALGVVASLLMVILTASVKTSGG